MYAPNNHSGMHVPQTRLSPVVIEILAIWGSQHGKLLRDFAFFNEASHIFFPS